MKTGLAMKQMLVLAALCSALPAAAQVFKCKDASGATTYSSQPCTGARAIETRQAAPREYQCVVGEGRLVWQDTPCKGDPHGGMNTVGEEMERKRKAKEQAAAQAVVQQQACADKFKGKLEVENSPWDGSVHAVERYLKADFLKDPDSFQAIEWGKVVKGCGTYAVALKYRARNSFGGYVVETRIFSLDADGVVTGSTPYR